MVRICTMHCRALSIRKCWHVMPTQKAKSARHVTSFFIPFFTFVFTDHCLTFPCRLPSCNPLRQWYENSMRWGRKATCLHSMYARDSMCPRPLQGPREKNWWTMILVSNMFRFTVPAARTCALRSRCKKNLAW